MENQTELIELLKQGAAEFNIDLQNEHVQKFWDYKELLIEWNKKINLTAIEDDREVVIKHFVDSLSVLKHIKDEEQKIIDVGTGAGFPGIPIGIVYKNANIVLLDSLDKRIKFLNEVISRLELKKVTAVHGRAEDMGVKEEYREKFDVAVARAVASLPVLLEYCLPFVKVDGLFIAMKGSSIDEVKESGRALSELGGEIVDIKEFVLPFTDAKRNIILIKKFRHTPTKYPRKAGKPSKIPLI